MTSAGYLQWPITCKQSSCFTLLMSACWRVVEKESSRELLGLSHWRRGLCAQYMGKQDSSVIFLDSGKLKVVGKAIQKYPHLQHSRIPLPPTAAEETQPGFAVLSICTLHTQLSNLCCFLPKSTVGSALCTKCISISGSSSKCPH